MCILYLAGLGILVYTLGMLFLFSCRISIFNRTGYDDIKGFI